MKQPFSNRLPPGLNQPVQGSLNILISSPSFSSKAISSAINYSIKFWGQSEQESPFFESTSEGMYASYLICCSREIFSKYLFDMQTLVILLHDARNIRNIGMIPIQLKRYSTLNSHGSVQIDSIRERFSIFDLKKVKIGEVDVDIQMNYDSSSPGFKVPPVRMQRIQEMDESIANRTQNQIVQQMEQRKQPNNKRQYNTLNRNKEVYDQKFQHPSLPPLPPRRNKHQYPMPVSQKLHIPFVNLQLQALKLKNDEYLFLKQEAPTANDDHHSQIQYIIEIISIKLRSKVPKAIQKLTLIYPQQNNTNHITSIIKPLRIEGSTYYFGQELVVRIKKQVDNMMEDINLQVYFGEGHIDTPLNKLKVDTKEEVLVLKKKDTTRHSELSVRVRTQVESEEMRLYLYLGRYAIYNHNSYFFKLNFRSELDSKLIIPTDASSINFEGTFATSGKPDVCFIEIWEKTNSQQVIKGSLQLSLQKGALYQRIPLQTITQEKIGWLEVYYCIDDQSKIQDIVQQFKESLRTQQSNQQRQKSKDIPPSEIEDKPNNHSTVRRIPLQPKPEFKEPPPPFNLVELRLSFSDLYVRLLNNWHINIDPQNKKLSDHLASLEEISKTELKWWFQKLITPSESQSLLSIFPEKFKFEYLVSSYYKYSSYLILYRKRVETLIGLLYQSQANIQKLIQSLSGAIAYFGYIELQQARNILMKGGINYNLAENILNLLANDDRNMVFKKTIIDCIRIKKAQGIVPNGRILAYLMRAEGVEIGDEWELEEVTHFQFIVLKDNNPQQVPDFESIHTSDTPSVEEYQVIEAQSGYSSQQQHIIKQPFKPLPKKQLTELRIQGIESQIPSLTDIIINRKMYLSLSQLPKTIKVYNQQQLLIRVHTAEGVILEASVLIDKSMKNKSTGLFVKGKEMGRVFFGDHEGDVVINYEKTHQLSSKQILPRELLIEPSIQEIEEPVFQLGSTPLNLEILDITPSGKYSIDIEKGQPCRLNYPQQYSTTIVFSTNKVKLTITNASTSSHCSVYLKEGVQKYPLSKEDGSILCVIQIKVSRNYTTNTHLSSQRQRLFLIIKDLYRFMDKVSTPLVYLMIEYNNTFKKTEEFSLKHYRDTIDYSLEVEESELYSLKLFGRKDKLLCKFQFRVKFQPGSKVQVSNTILSCEQYRITLSFYQIVLERELGIREDKVQNIMRVFSVGNIRTIYRELGKKKELKQILKSDLQYTLSQISIIEELLVDHQPIQFFSIFNNKSKPTSTHTAKNVLDEFSIFDFQGNGFVTKQKALLVCRLLEIQEPIDQFIPSNATNIIDNNCANLDQVDYYQLIIKSFPDQLFDNQSNVDSNVEVEELKGYVRVELVGFYGLLYRDKPPNLCFQINGQFITDPILRCSTYQYQEYPQMIVDMPAKLKIFNKQYGGDTLWSYKLIAESPLSQIIEVLGGRIKFRIEKLREQQIKHLQPSQKIEKSQERVPEPRIISSIEESSHIPIQNPFEKIYQPQTIKPSPMKESRRLDLTQQQISEAQRINSILSGQVNIGKYRFQSSDEQY